MFRHNTATVLLLFLLVQNTYSQLSCEITTDFPLVSPGTTLDLSVKYTNFEFPSPIFVICRPNKIQMCFADKGSGECEIKCDYPYKGVYTVTGASVFSQCVPSLVVADPEAKPTCILKPEKTYANGTLTTRIDVRFTNLLPNTTSTTVNCGNGQQPQILQLIDKKTFFICSYSSESKKETFTASAVAGLANCKANMTTIPTQDSVPPEVSFYNITYRMAVNDTHRVVVRATDNVEVKTVKLYIDGELVWTVNKTPYIYMWNLSNYTRGSIHTVKAEAIDLYGNSASTVDHEVYRAYSGKRLCNLTAIPRYSPLPAAINLTAVFQNTSSDVLYAIMKPYSSYNQSGPRISIINGTAKTTMAYNVAGVYLAYATDGNSSCTTKVYITATADASPPRVTLTAPKNNKKIQLSDNVAISATVVDNVVVRNVEFYLGNKLLNNDTGSPYKYYWDTTDEKIGYYKLGAIAYDDAGNPSIRKEVDVLLYTNKTCEISPYTVRLLPKQKQKFTINCFNYTKSTGTEYFTNKTSANGTKVNFTIVTGTNVTNFSTKKISCPNMEWTSTMFWSDISPKNSSTEVWFTAQNTESEIPGTLTATDPISGISCTADVLIMKTIPNCTVDAHSIIIAGSSVPVTVSYNNLSRPQEFRITCRPNDQELCSVQSGSGECTVLCDYPILEEVIITAKSRYAECQSKKITVLPYPDIVPPVVTITKPFDGQIVSEVIQIEAYATDNFGVSKVEFYSNDEYLGKDNIPPYRISLNTSEFQGGKKKITAKAYDASENTREYSIELIFAN